MMRIGTCVPAVSVALRLLSVVTLGSAWTSSSDTDCKACRNVVKSNAPRAAEYTSRSAALGTSCAAFAIPASVLSPR